MLRFIYQGLLRLHPPAFRKRFAEEMQSIFEQVTERSARVKLWADGFLSLLRQWSLRPEFWHEFASGGEHATPDGIPSFYTLDPFRPRTTAVVHGLILTVAVFCLTCFAIRYSWIHVLRVRIPKVQFESSSSVVPGAAARPDEREVASHPGGRTQDDFSGSSRSLQAPQTQAPSPTPITAAEQNAGGISRPAPPGRASKRARRVVVERMPSEQRAISPHPERGPLKESSSSLGQPLFSEVQAAAPLSKAQVQDDSDASRSTPLTSATALLSAPTSHHNFYEGKSDPSRHTARLITVASNVKLEVLDWGGSGRPLVLLAGLGNTAHVFDSFAPKLAATFHVYGITRRGFGASSVPADTNGNYSADRLGDDVLAIVDSLGLNRPVLVGHSMAGEELSSIGTRHPEKIAGLVYLDAGYSYAFYDRSRGDPVLDSLELRRKLEQLIPGRELQNPKQVVQDLLTILPKLERTLREHQRDMQFVPEPLRAPGQVPVAEQAIVAGEQKYSNIRCPILAIFAIPHNLGPAFQDDPVARAAAEATDALWSRAQARAFETGLPSARVVRLSNASHFVFQSNEADVLREMNAFIRSLP